MSAETAVKEQIALQEQIDRDVEHGWEIRFTDPETAGRMAHESYVASNRIGYIRGMAYSQRNLGGWYAQTSNYELALRYIDKSLVLMERLNDPGGLADVLGQQGFLYSNLGGYEMALGSFARAIKMSIQAGNPAAQAVSVMGMAIVYYDTKDYQLAHNGFEEALKFFKEYNHPVGIARCLGGLGNVHEHWNELQKAESYHRQSLAALEGHTDQTGQARAMHHLGQVLYKQQKYPEALALLTQALALRRGANARQAVCATLSELARVYLYTGRIDEALAAATEALELAREIKARPKIYQAHDLLYQIYRHTGDTALALEHLEKSVREKDGIVNEDSFRRLKELQVQLATEDIQDHARQQQQQNDHLNASNMQLTQALGMIEDSIHYARRIQSAILPSEETIQRVLPQSFVFFLPREAVSGDFYWMSERGSTVVLAAIDCTGHGVPGAMMSMLGYSLLNQIVNEKGITAPAEILEHLDQGLYSTLRKQHAGSTEQVLDGMEAALVRLDTATGSLNYAGAGIPMYLASATGLRQIKANRGTLGMMTTDGSPARFDSHTVVLAPGDSFYLFSDGFKDQFGTQVEVQPRHQKYSSKRFEELLATLLPLPPDKQLSVLKEEFFAWKGHARQLDDVMVIGVKWPG